MKSFVFMLMLASTGNGQASPSCVYPDELPQYRLCETAGWRTLRPLVSTAADVRAALGKPTDETDLAAYSDPYPGDERAKAPVLTFDAGPDWEILVYFVRTDARARATYPPAVYDRLLSIDFVPQHRIPFGQIKFPPSFERHHIVAADAAWDEYRHPSGLVYQVYTTRTPHSDTQPGDLNRISYGVADEAREAHRGDRSN